MDEELQAVHPFDMNHSPQKTVKKKKTQDELQMPYLDFE